MADNYQGEEIIHNSLVDPDNRRPVHYPTLSAMLAELDEQGLPGQAELSKEKLWVTSRLLRLRREMSEVFVGADAYYHPLPVTTGHAFAYVRSLKDDPRVAIVTERLARGLSDAGGFHDHTVVLPEGTWTDVLTGQTYEGGSVRLSDLLDKLPVAALRKDIA